MAVRTDRDEILPGVNPVAARKLRERCDVVDVDEPSECFAVNGAKLEAADDASGTVTLDAFQTCLGVPLIGINGDRASGSFPKIRGDFL